MNQARWGVHGDHSIIALTASNHQDVFAITVDAFNFSETYRTPVILLFDEVVGHMREGLRIPEPGEIPLVERLKTSVREGVDYHPYLPREDGRLPMSDFGGAPLQRNGPVPRHVGIPSENPQVVHDLLRHLVDKIESHVDEVTRYREYFVDDAEILLISYGSSARSALHVVADRRKHGERIGLLELQTLWPFPSALVREKTRNARYVVVVEMNMGQVLQSVRGRWKNRSGSFYPTGWTGIMITPVDIRNILRLIQGKGV